MSRGFTLSDIYAGETLNSSELQTTTRVVVAAPWGSLAPAPLSDVATFLGNNGLVASYQTANTIYVDATNGSDSTGAKGYPNKPYATISAAATASSAGDCIVVYPGNYTHSGSAINIKSGQHWQFLGVNLDHTVKDATLFSTGSSGDIRTDFSVSGRLSITGTGLSDGGSFTSRAFDLSYSQRFSLSGIRIGAGQTAANGNTDGFAGTGFYSTSSSNGTLHDCHTRYALTGLNFIAGAEYHRISNCSFNNSSNNVIVIGGNNHFSNCHANYSLSVAVELGTGSNHAHGSWVGGSISHSAGYAVYAGSVTLGFLFQGVHLHADSSTTNLIELNASQGVIFQGCQFSSPWKLSGTLPGKNLIQNCFIPFNPSNVVLTDTGTQIGNLVIDGCYTPSGAWTSF